MNSHESMGQSFDMAQMRGYTASWSGVISKPIVLVFLNYAHGFNLISHSW